MDQNQFREAAAKAQEFLARFIGRVEHVEPLRVLLARYSWERAPIPNVHELHVLVGAIEVIDPDSEISSFQELKRLSEEAIRQVALSGIPG